MPAENTRPHARIPRQEDYTGWLISEHRVDAAWLKPEAYEGVASQLLSCWQTSQFWGRLCAALPQWDEEFRSRCGYPLLSTAERGTEPAMGAEGAEESPFVAPLIVKSFESFLLRTYRGNVL